MDLGRGRQRRCAAIFALAGLWMLAAAASVGAVEDPAASMYRPGAVNVIKLTLPEASYKALQADPEGEYQPGTFSMAETDGTPVGIGEYSAPLEAQIRLKGSGSFRPLGQKAAFKIKFGKKAPFRGLRKMTLNNMVQDVSMVHEALSYRLFHALGVPAPRTSFAEVWVNGVDYGLHTNIESLDKVALEKRFGTFEDPPQHLYEGEYNADVTPGRISLLEVDEGDEEDRSDLNALAAASNAPGGDWSNAVAPHAKLLEMTRMWMGEKYIGHVDGYAGESNTNRPNNFYLYSDPLGQFRMLPWGTDQTWVFNAPFGSAGGSLFSKCIADSSCLALYKATGHRALNVIPALDLRNMASCLALRLTPWQRREPPSMAPNSQAAIASAVASTKTFVAGERAKLATYLGVPTPAEPTSSECPAYGTEPDESLEEPPAGSEEEEAEGPEEEPEEPEEEESGEEEPEEEPGEGEEEGGGEEEAPQPPNPGGATPPLNVVSLAPQPLVLPEESPLLVLRVGQIGFDSRGLVVQIKAPRAGKLRLRVATDGRSGALCEARRHIKAGFTAVGCRLESGDLTALTAHRRWLTIGASLRTDGGEKLNCWQTVKSPRQ